MVIKKNIFKILEKTYIKNLFEKKKNFYFPSLNGKKILDMNIEKRSPDWAKESCLVRYEILFEGNTKKIIRGTAKKKSIKSVWQIMKYLHFHNFSRSSLQISRPLDYIPKINLLLYEESPGATLTEIIEKENKKIIEKNLKNVARWLAKLHDLDFRKKKLPKAVFFDFDGYKDIFYKIEKYIPELKSDLTLLNKTKFINKIWKNKKNLIHNDFYPGNIIIDGDKLYIIDLDRAGLGPCLMDVATLQVSLSFPLEIWQKNLSEIEIQKFQEIFLRTYCQLRRLNYQKTKKNLEKFLAQAYYRVFLDYAILTMKGWPSLTKNDKKAYEDKIKSLLKKIKEYPPYVKKY